MVSPEVLVPCLIRIKHYKKAKASHCYPPEGEVTSEITQGRVGGKTKIEPPSSRIQSVDRVLCTSTTQASRSPKSLAECCQFTCVLIIKIELATFLSSKLPAKIAQLFLGVCAALLAKILPSVLSRSLRQALVIQYRSTRACVRSLVGVVVTASGPSLLNVSTGPYAAPPSPPHSANISYNPSKA